MGRSLLRPYFLCVDSSRVGTKSGHGMPCPYTDEEKSLTVVFVFARGRCKLLAS